MRLKVKIQPRSKKNEIAGILPNGTIKIKIAAPPLEGRANKELVKFLSEEYSVPKSQIQILQGKNSSYKLVEMKKPQ